MDSDLLDDFADFQRQKGLSPKTIACRASILRTLAARAGIPLQDITTRHLRRHLGREHITQATRRTERGAIVMFYQFLHDERIIDEDPAERLPRVHVPRGMPRPFTAHQIDRLLTSGARRRTRAMILLGYYQGFRVSSIAAVHGDDIDLAAGTIRTVAKGSKHLVFPLHSVIRELAATMPAHDWWFPARRGEPGHISGAGVTGLIRRAKIRAGINDPKLTAHSLRHSFATDLVEADTDIAVVSELMGHESVATTQIYAGVSTRRKREALDRLAPRQIPIHAGRAA